MLLYSMLISGAREFCYENGNQDSVFNSTTSQTIGDDDDDDDVKKFTNVAKYVTFYSVSIEVDLGFLTVFCFAIKFSCCTHGSAADLHGVDLQETDDACFVFTLNHIWKHTVKQ